MSDLRRAISFASGLYRQRAGVAFAGYGRRDPLARLTLRPGRANPYAIYDRLRASGPLVPTPPGQLVVHQLPRLQHRAPRPALRRPPGRGGPP